MNESFNVDFSIVYYFSAAQWATITLYYPYFDAIEMKDMFALQFSHIFLLVIILKAKGTNGVLHLWEYFDFGEMGQKCLVKVCDIRFKISKDKYYILAPKHYIVASQVVDKQ